MIFAIVFLHTLLCLKKPIYGLCSLLSIRLLIPVFVKSGIGGISLNTLSLVILVLVVCVNNYSKLPNLLLKRVEFKYIRSFFIGLLALIFLAEIPVEFQFKALIQFFVTEVLPAILGIVIIQSQRDLKLFVYTLVVCYLINGLYGLFCFYVGSNPYYMYFVYLYGDINTQMDFSSLSREKGGLQGYAAGLTTGGPLVWSQVSMLVAAYILETRDLLSRKISIPFFLLLILNCFLTGQRASFFAITCSLLYFFRSFITVKMALRFLLFVPLFLFLMEFAPQLKALKANVYSTFLFFDDEIASKNKIGGSTMELRLHQSKATIETLLENPIAGKGYDWPAYQYKNAGITDQGMAGYESIFFVVGWSSGVTGLIIWIIFLFRCLCIIRCKNRRKYTFRKVFWLSYMISCLATGIQSTFFLFMLLIVLCRKETEIMEYRINYIK